MRSFASLTSAGLALMLVSSPALASKNITSTGLEDLVLVKVPDLSPSTVSTPTPTYVELVARQDAGNNSLISTTTLPESSTLLSSSLSSVVQATSSTVESSSVTESSIFTTVDSSTTDFSSTSPESSTFSSSSDPSPTSASETQPTSSPETTTEPSTTQEQSTSTEASVASFLSTNSDGQTTLFATTVEITHTLIVSRSADVESSATSSSTATSDNESARSENASGSVESGSLATSAPDDNSGGLSTKDRNIVIGVVVGVGGFLLLLGVAFVCWKMWGGNKKLFGSGSHSRTSMEKNESLDDSSDVFRANIDQYHAPAPNTAANF